MQQLPQLSETLTEATGNVKVHQPPPVIELPSVIYGPDAQRAIVSLENEYDIRFPPPPPRRDVSLRAIGCGSTMDDDDGFGNADVIAQTTIILNESTPGSPGNIIVRRGNSITNLAEIPLQGSSTVQQYQVQPDAAAIQHFHQATTSPQPSTTVNVTTRIRDLTSQVMRESENVNRATQRLRRQRPAPPLNRVYSAESKLWNLMSLENKLANEIANYRASGRVRDPEFLNALTQTEEKLRRLMSAENSAAQDIRRIKKESFKQETYKLMTPRNRYSPQSSISTSMSSYTPPKSPSVSQPMVMMPQPQMMPLMQTAGGPQGGFMASPMYPGMLRVTIDSPECTCSTSSSASSSSESLPKRIAPREETKIVVEIPKPPAVPPPPPPPPP
ncbi:uncharacterized protein LOC115326065, partial [Ixodes scapularis]|uniref:uncharacterized protein LOC115326065 n=1 Tax=Ixodes scapularis TaxID=6945 RepID=UPI001A9DEE2C